MRLYNILRHCLLIIIVSWYIGLIDNSSLAQSLLLPPPTAITDRQGLSQGFITGIVQDRQGFIWIASRDGLCRYDGRTFRTFKPTANGKASLSFPGLGKLVLDHRGMIWILSERGDLDRFDPRTETFTNISQLPAYKQAFSHSGPRDVWLDRRDRLWIIFNAWGVGLYDIRTGRCQLYGHPKGDPNTLENAGISFAEDNRGRCWVATQQGLTYFDEAQQRFIAPTFPVPHDEVNGLYRTRDGQFLIGSSQHLIRLNPLTGQTHAYPLPPKRVVWDLTHFTTDNKGVIYFQREGLLYRYTNKEGPQLLRAQSPGSSIEQGQSLWVDRSDVLWVGMNGSGIRTYDLRENPFQTAPYQVSFHVDLLRRWLGVKQNLPPSYVANGSSYNFRYTVDQEHRIWFNAATQPFQRLDLVSGHLTTIPSPAPPTGTGPNPYPMATDPAGQIWVMYDTLAWHYQEETSRWIPFDHTICSSDPPLQLVVDKQALWLATSRRGLLRIDRRTGVHRQYTHVASNPASINSNSLFCMSADPTDPNRLWIGTFGAGLCAFDKRTGQCRRFTEVDGLPNNVIYSVIPDGQGYLWMGTNKGLVRMHRKTFQMRTYTHEDGLLADEFNRFHFLYMPRLGTTDDHIYMGGVEGITAFSPRQIQDDRFSPSVEITQIQINNQPLSLSPPDTTAVPFLPVQVLRELALPYDQNFLTVRFAVAQYNKPEKNRFRYQLEGLTSQWVETTQPEAVYTNLSPGHYLLKLNASNTSGQWSPHVRTLSISIHPPYWATWWAYMGYGLIVFCLAYVVLRSYINRLRLQQKLTLQQQNLAFQERETQQLRMIDETKTRFFSNVTHEFRTPLTLILTPVQLLKQKYADTDDQSRLGFIERNAYQLLELINQLLDLSKLEAKAMTVRRSIGNLSEFIEETVRSFQEEAEHKHIELGYQSQLTGDFLFDRAKLERIIYNLVSNALKFSRADDRVVVTLQETNDGFVQIIVTDTGIGISPEQLPFIFNRFYQVGDTASRPRSADDSLTRSQEGTGIGLALVKELVDIQAGTVLVSSQPGVGTTFTIRLPYQPAFNGQTVPKTIDNYQGSQPINKSHPNAESPLILLVEDNDDLAEFIIQSLPAWYQVERASNGARGLEIAIERMPDLVLSDVLMPVMDGYTLCEKLKADPHTSHIPVVLLTAKNTLANRVKGLGLGADDYITKPFHLAELQIRIQNLLDNRQRLRDWIRQSLADLDRVVSTDELAQSDPFLIRFYTILNNNLDDPEFGINQLSREIGMSRASLYRKLEAISSLPVNELIQNYRLKRATEYLRDGQTIIATAYLVGFSSHSYFSSCFRKLYQLTPSEFITQWQQTN